MKKQFSFIAILLLMVGASTLFAQAGNNAVKTLTQSLRSHKNMEVRFTYQTIGDPNQSEEPKPGTFYLQGKAYKFLMEDHHAISDGKTTWDYIIEDEEVMVGNATDDNNPYHIIDDLDRDSSGLTPVFDKKGNLKGLEIELDEGIKMVLNFTEMKFDQDYPEDFFTFDEKAHPNVDIIDMR